MRRIKKFATTWWVTGSFHKASSFDSHINFLGNTEKSNESARNQLNGTYCEETLKMTRWMRYVRNPKSCHSCPFKYLFNMEQIGNAKRNNR